MNTFIRKTTHLLVGIILLLVGAGMLTGCDDGGYWGPDIPGGGYFDPTLRGAWELIQINNNPVGGYNVNYLDFYGGGTGRYYYYYNGIPYEERISYWCATGYTRRTITINYENGQTSTMNYWFSGGDNYLWLEWQTGGGYVTYCYRYVNSIPWY